MTAVTVTPGANTGELVAAVQLNNGKLIRGGHYLFKVFSVSPTNLTGVQDNTGNGLDGEFYGTFPSGNNHAGGDFIAELDAIHNTVEPPKTVIGPASPVNPPSPPGTTTASHVRHSQKTPHAGGAVKLSTGKASPKSTLHIHAARPLLAPVKLTKLHHHS